ncbi:MAG: Hpt domain-containing protein [Pseudomonadota bacterium]
MFNRAHIPETHYDFQASVQLMGNKESVARELAVMLKEQLLEFGTQLKIAFEKNNPTEIQTIAHKLHGGICYVITPRLKYLIAQLETACKQHPEDIPLIKPYIGSSIDDLYATLTHTFQ